MQIDNNPADNPIAQEINEIIANYSKEDIYGQLNMKISYPQQLKNVSWPIIKDDHNYEYSYSQSFNGFVYYYCRSKRSGCTEPKMEIDIKKKTVHIFLLFRCNSSFYLKIVKD